MQKGYEIIEHTADIGIRVKAADLKGIFEKSARAMFELIAEKKKKGLKKTVKIELEDDNLEELFVSWLNELLSLSAVKELIFSGFKIENLGNNNLSAKVEGSPVSNYKVHKEIKAATYHELSLREISSGWQAEVIFDV